MTWRDFFDRDHSIYVNDRHKRLHAEIDKAVDSPDARARLANVGCEPAPSSSADFSAMIRRELPRWARVVKDSGATVD